MSRGRIRALGVLGVCFIALLSQPALAGFSLVSQHIFVDRTDQQVTFDLAFSQPPDFVALDANQRPVDSFQYEIVPNVVTSIDQFSFDDIRAVIRGGEIGKGHAVPIRDGFENGSDPSPASGGWGSVLGSVPFAVHGNDLNFSVPFSLLGTTQGDFAYRVFTTSFGTTVSEVEGNSVSVPLPPARTTGFIGLGVLGIGFAVRRKFSKARFFDWA